MPLFAQVSRLFGKVVGSTERSLSQFWDAGKVQIQLFCQQYTALSSSEAMRVLGELERSISEVEVELVWVARQCRPPG